MADFNTLWSPAKVFSPTATKESALSLKDWAHVDHFLETHFSPNPVPKFERNPATLRALLSLASANESANESHNLAHRVKQKSLAELRARDEAAHANTNEPLITKVEEALTPEGTRCLNSVALLSVACASSSTEPVRLAGELAVLAAEEAAVAEATRRVDAVHGRLRKELSEVREEMRGLESGPEFTVPAELTAKVQEWGRNSRVVRRKAEDYKSELEHYRAVEGVRLPELVEREREVIALRDRVKDLEGQQKAYQGLPTDSDLARMEVERMQAELEELVAKRDAFYDDMVGGPPRG